MKQEVRKLCTLSLYANENKSRLDLENIDLFIFFFNLCILFRKYLFYNFILTFDFIQIIFWTFSFLPYTQGNIRKYWREIWWRQIALY